MNDKHHVELADLKEEIRGVFGTGYRVESVTRMHGGAQKAVYRIGCGSGFSCVLYVWDPASNYFREEIAGQDADRSYGSDLFERNYHYLERMGVRTPALYAMNKERRRYPFDYALVEYVEGPKAEAYFRHSDSQVRDRLFRRLGEMLAGMHADVRDAYGKIGQDVTRTGPCHMLQLENAKAQLAYAARHLADMKASQERLLEAIDELASRLKPRARYGFIHGELGPDHVLVGDKLEPYLIDIEGAMHFDIEHEHTFLELRFGEFYEYLRNDRLDQGRMAFYRLHHHISLTSGGLKLQHRGFPDQAFARNLAAYHSRRAMQLLEEHE